jgi:hypothetical protein
VVEVSFTQKTPYQKSAPNPPAILQGARGEIRTTRAASRFSSLVALKLSEWIPTTDQKGTNMADEKKWEESKDGGKPEGNGGTSTREPTQPEEVAGRARQMVAVCPKCGVQSYVGGDWKWFTCWKCGGTNSEMVC